MKSKIFSFSLPSDIEELIEALSEKLHMPKSQVIRLAITKLYEKEVAQPDTARGR